MFVTLEGMPADHPGPFRALVLFRVGEYERKSGFAHAHNNLRMVSYLSKNCGLQ
jgi:hypothetical protein